ncbi:MAG: 5'-nucleotidase C-terminal domain-containing protein [Chitinophagaceae bacterium]|nr:5'-nucleotidase C-terminal domain-containing protein [Chitinophagaceae bacterium]
MKSYKHYWLLFIPFLIACKVRYHATDRTFSQYKIQANAENFQDSVSEIARYLQPFRDSLTQEMNVLLGTSSMTFEKGKGGGTLGRLVVQAFEQAARKNFNKPISGVITNPGGLRMNQLPEGPITTGKIFELLPFENELVILAVPGDILETWMKLTEEKGGWPHSMFMPYATYQEKPIRSYLPANNINRELHPTYVESILNLTKTKTDSMYYIATNDYLANGGDNCDFLKPCKQIHTHLLLRSILIQYIKEEKNIQLNYSPEERWWFTLFQTDTKFKQ